MNQLLGDHYKSLVKLYSTKDYTNYTPIEKGVVYPDKDLTQYFIDLINFHNTVGYSKLCHFPLSYRHTGYTRLMYNHPAFGTMNDTIAFSNILTIMQNIYNKHYIQEAEHDT